MNRPLKLSGYFPVYIIIGFINISGIREIMEGSYTLRVMLGVFGATMLDLILGIRKARSLGSFNGSYGLTRTVDKLIKYFAFVLLGAIGDSFMKPAQIDIPWMTMIAGLIIIGLEVISWFEKAEKKEQKRIRWLIRAAKRDSESVKELINVLRDIENDKENNKENDKGIQEL
jgi:hypothetical protein